MSASAIPSDETRHASVREWVLDCPVERLLPMLDDPNWTIRRTVIAALAARGNAAVPALCGNLCKQRDHEGRIAATVDALVASTGEVEAAMRPLMQYGDVAVVADVAQILGRRQRLNGIAMLMELCEHPDDNVAVMAMEGLGNRGARLALKPLFAALRSGNFFRVFPAIDVLGRSGDPRSIAPLAALLQEPQYSAEVVRALGRSAMLGALRPLAEVLGGTTLSLVRVAAIACLDLYGRFRELYAHGTAVEHRLQRLAPPTALRSIIRALEGADEAEQSALCGVLAMLGDLQAVPALTPLLTAPPRVAHAAAAALQKLGHRVESSLWDALRDGDSARRQALLPLVGPHSDAREVVWCLRDGSPEVRVLACDTLARIGNPATVPALFHLLSDTNLRVSQAAASAIVSLGSNEACDLAIGAACLPNPRVRRAALGILADLAYEPALDTFLVCLQDVDLRVRDAAIAGLARLRDSRAGNTLLMLARTGEAHSRAMAARALGRGAPMRGHISQLLECLDDADPWVRYYAAQSLGRLRCEAAVPALLRRLRDPAEQVQLGAVEALAMFKSAPAFAALQDAARSADGDIRRAGILGLGMQARPECVPVLCDALSSGDAATRLAAISALGHLRTADVLPALESCVRDAQPDVRTAAIDLLAYFCTPEATRLLIRLVAESADCHQALQALPAGRSAHVAGILSSLEHASDDLAALLCATLVRLQGPDAVLWLEHVASLANGAARRAALIALGALDVPAAVAVLQRSARDPDPDIACLAAAVLEG